MLTRSQNVNKTSSICIKGWGGIVDERRNIKLASLMEQKMQNCREKNPHMFRSKRSQAAPNFSLFCFTSHNTNHITFVFLLSRNEYSVNGGALRVSKLSSQASAFQLSIPKWRKAELVCSTTSSRFLFWCQHCFYNLNTSSVAYFPLLSSTLNKFHCLLNFTIVCNISLVLFQQFYYSKCCSEAWEPFKEQLVRSQVLSLWVPQPRQCDRSGKPYVTSSS